MKLKEKTITLDELLFYSVKYPQLKTEDLTIFLLAKAAFPKRDEDLTFFTPAELTEKLKKGGLIFSIWKDNIIKSLERTKETGLVKTAAARTILLDKNGNETGYGSERVYAVI